MKIRRCVIDPREIHRSQKRGQRFFLKNAGYDLTRFERVNRGRGLVTREGGGGGGEIERQPLYLSVSCRFVYNLRTVFFFLIGRQQLSWDVPCRVGQNQTLLLSAHKSIVARIRHGVILGQLRGPVERALERTGTVAPHD